MINKKPNILERTIFKNKLAKEIYANYLLPNLHNFGTPTAKGKLQNILQINTAAGRGGAAKVAHDFLNVELNKRGLNSKLLVGTDYLKSDRNVSQLNQTNMPLHKALHKASRDLGWLDFYNPESFNIENLDIYKNADILHLHNVHGAYFSPFALPKLTSLKPTIWTLHDEQSYTGHCSFSFECKKWEDSCGNCPRLSYYPKLKKDTTEFLINTKKKIYENSNLTLVCPSQWLKNRVQKSILGNKDVRVIYNGINTEIFNPVDKIEARKILSLPQDKKILMFSASGSLNNLQKGGEFIIKIYDLLKHNPEIIFVNIGGNADKKKENWIDIPYINDEKTMALYYSASDVFIYPSMAETFGLVIAEAMSCGTPVVAFNNTAIPEIIKHMETGYLAENKNIEDFIKGIKIFLENDELRKNAEIKAEQEIRSNFTLDKMISNYVDVYQEIWEANAKM